MAHVTFEDPDQFMDEIETEKNAGRIDRPIVRFTMMLQPTDVHPISNVIAVATALVGSDLLRMDFCCGSLWGMQDNPFADEQFDHIERTITDRCQELGLDLRQGMFHTQKC